MAQKFSDQGLTESPRPILPASQASIHPGLHPSVTNVPVTPGIEAGEYASGSSGVDEDSYFKRDIHRLRMAQSPSEAASGAKTNQEILRRMSFGGTRGRRESLSDVDPRAAHPSLGLSGGLISATFCIPHSLRFRKGADWVNFSSSIDPLLQG